MLMLTYFPYFGIGPFFKGKNMDRISGDVGPAPPTLLRIRAVLLHTEGGPQTNFFLKCISQPIIMELVF